MMSPHRLRRARRGGDRSERGIVLVYTALMITTIVGFAGFSVDFGRWYVESSRIQNATDAAALGGVVFIASDFDSAEDVARELMGSHGYDDVDDITIEYGESANQLRVTASSRVENVFASVFGVTSTTIRRSALAEYLGPVPLGSPENALGNDPDDPDSAPDYWLNVAGPRATKASGDRFAAKNCPSSVARCDGGQLPNNLDYSPQGYMFSVEVDAPTGDDLQIELFDGVMAYVGDTCTNATFPSAAQRAELAAIDPVHFGDAGDRFAPGNSGAQALFCTGDQDISGRNVETTVIVREPDATPWLSTDNPVVDTSTCSPTTLPDVNTGGNRIYELLHPTAGSAAENNQAVFDPDDGFLSFAELFRQWAPVCTIPGDDVVAGEYLVQIRTNVTSFDQLDYDPTVNTGGHNRFSMRAGFADDADPDTPVVGTGIQLYARGKFPIYANKEGANTSFYLARVDERYAGRSLNVVLFDIGDANQEGTLTIVPPDEAEANGNPLDAFGGCSFFRDDNAALAIDTSSCTLEEVQNSNGFNGRIVEIVVPIPEGYTCAQDDVQGCWITVLADFPGGVQDTTTWAAEVIGDPVRLIE